ncbi:hypothetical protein NUW54_g14030 [Trametes sanguinea]|uniref:Uncharacterized protein n=1 Tax=Trametes sanguinea TaxID=158606 RepID=A0ACC1MHH9_9APHY|nr:hypothetical protein NUW54_g14030 [Trametes sanguinea]
MLLLSAPSPSFPLSPPCSSVPLTCIYRLAVRRPSHAIALGSSRHIHLDQYSPSAKVRPGPLKSLQEPGLTLINRFRYSCPSNHPDPAPTSHTPTL